MEYCSIAIANALVILQSCTKWSICIIDIIRVISKVHIAICDIYSRFEISVRCLRFVAFWYDLLLVDLACHTNDGYVYYVCNLFRDWDTVLKKYWVSGDNIPFGQMYNYITVNIGSGDGFFPFDTKPFPEPMYWEQTGTIGYTRNQAICKHRLRYMNLWCIIRNNFHWNRYATFSMNKINFKIMSAEWPSYFPGINLVI